MVAGRWLSLFLKYAPGTGSPCFVKAMVASGVSALPGKVVPKNVPAASAANPNLITVFICIEISWARSALTQIKTVAACKTLKKNSGRQNRPLKIG
jgi:hypothetical protein